MAGVYALMLYAVDVTLEYSIHAQTPNFVPKGAYQ